MEPQLQHTHGRRYDEHDTAIAGAGHDYNEDERHGEKKSVIKKVKAKAKKLKDTITKHGHGHGGHDHDHHDDEEDDDEEMVEDPEVHGAPMYESAAAVGIGLSGPDAILSQPRGNLERPSVMSEDGYTTRSGEARHGAPPPVSTGPYGTNLSNPSGLGHPQASGQEVNPEKWRGKVGQSTGMEEVPFAPNPTRMVSPTNVTNPTYGTTYVPGPVGNRGQGQDVNREELRGTIGKSTGMVADPHAPKDPSVVSVPSNYETKVTDPTHTGGKEAEVSQIQHSFDEMGIRDEHYSGSHGQSASEPKSFDPTQPENLPRETLTGNPSSRSSSYTEKISSSASAIAGKAAIAKDVIASKLGYSGQSPSSTESHETVKQSGSPTDYGHTITEMVTGTLAPVYEKVADAGSSVMSKVKGTVSGTGTGQTQVHREPDTSSGTVEKGKGADKGVSVKDYLVETLKPGDEDKTLSEVITHPFHRGNYGESEKKSGEDRPPTGRVTESEEVRHRLGTDREEQQQQQQQQQHSSNVSADKGVADRLKDAVGSLFVGKGNAPEGSLGTSYVTDEGLSSCPTGDRNDGSAREQ